MRNDIQALETLRFAINEAKRVGLTYLTHNWDGDPQGPEGHVHIEGEVMAGGALQKTLVAKAYCTVFAQYIVAAANVTPALLDIIDGLNEALEKAHDALQKFGPQAEAASLDAYGHLISAEHDLHELNVPFTMVNCDGIWHEFPK